MKRLLKVLLARRLAATPVGALILGIGWLLGRRRRRRAQQAGRPADHRTASRPAQRPARRAARR
ncbi:DUF6203 family protein [Nonomuraea sp. NPDC050783]|uniref:DUF6203 family protein n=1 Tax=Nonomuraea sp. NPDC050783 TaxID=3154634 RepID=UPI0034662F46